MPDPSSAPQDNLTASTDAPMVSPPGNTSPNPRRTVQRKLSISEEAEAASSGRRQPPGFIRAIFETPFRTTTPTTRTTIGEATAYAMDTSARGPLNQVGGFIGNAILLLAIEEAATKPDGRVYGLKPGSLLTTATVITGIASAIFMPLVGAIVDHTRHRKAVGIITAFIVCVITAVQINISADTWFAVLVLEIFGGFFLIAHITAAMAYLPDLTEVEADLAHLTSRFNMVQYTFQLVYVFIVIGLVFGLQANTVKTAQMAAALAFAVSAIFMGYSWTFLFRKRPALSKVPEGENIISTGFKQIGKTAVKIWREYHALRWFMVALIWSPEAGAGVVLSIAVTFLTVQIGLTGGEIGIVNMTLLVFTLPGSAFAQWFIIKFNPLNSFRVSLIFFAASVAVTCVVMDSKEKKNWIYIFAAMWGICYGWVFPAQRVMQCTLIPRGQNNEIMGFFSFVTQILGWLPALLFSIMNEQGVDMRWGLSLVSFFITAAIFFTFLIGDYDKAVEQIQQENEREEERLRNEIKGYSSGSLDNIEVEA